jgi:hypothetical protein
MRNRLIVLLAGCGLLAIWTYPQIETTYSYWSRTDPGDWRDVPTPGAGLPAVPATPDGFVPDQPQGRWVPFAKFQRREFLTNVDFGTRPNIEIASDEIWPKVHSGAIRVPDSYWGYHVQKQIGLRWSTQALQSGLVLLLALGLLWLFCGPATKPAQ